VDLPGVGGAYCVLRTAYCVLRTENIFAKKPALKWIRGVLGMLHGKPHYDPGDTSETRAPRVRRHGSYDLLCRVHCFSPHTAYCALLIKKCLRTVRAIGSDRAAIMTVRGIVTVQFVRSESL